MMKKLIGSAVVSSLILLLFVPSTFAFSGGADTYSGLSGSSCTQCHAGGTEPTVTLTGPETLTPGETGSYVLTVLSADVAAQSLAGMAAAVGNAQGIEIGAFLNLESDLKVRTDQTAITHSGAKAVAADGTATFSFEYTAPSLVGTYTMYYVGNSVNGNGNPGGDAAMAGTLDIMVSDVDSPTNVSLRNATTVQSEMVLVLFAILLGVGTITAKRVD